MDDFDSLGIRDFTHQLPDLAGAYCGLVFVVGSARCVWDDLHRAGMTKNDDSHKHVLCVNDMIMHYPGAVEHAYSNNHVWLPKWIQARRDQYITRWGKPRYNHSNRAGGQHTWPWPGHGTSGLNAVYTAIALGYEDIRLCGIPLDDSGHYFEPEWMTSNFVREVPDKDDGLKYWSNAKKRIFKGRVTSYSGRTMKLLGEPS